MSNDTTYEHAMKIQNLQKELMYKKTLEYATVEDRENTIKHLESEIAYLTKNSNGELEPYEEWNTEAVPESAPEIFATAPVTAAVPKPSPADAPQPPQEHQSPPRKRHSLEDVYTGVSEVYQWLVSQSPTNAISLGGAIGFLHGCIWCLLFPRFTSFLLFILASTLAGLAGIAYRDIDMTPKQRDSITICGGVFSVIAVLMFFFWLMA